MRRVLWLVALLFFSGDLSAQTEGTGYWTYKEYMSLHPEQRQKAATFSAMVRAAAVPVQGLKERVKIAVVYPGKQVSDYWWRSVSSLEARLREHNLPYEIYPNFTEPGVDVRLQEKHIAQALETDPDYLVFTLDAFRHRSIIERIMTRGRPKLILQNITTPVRAWGDQQPFLYVGFDHALGSSLLSEKFVKMFPPQTEYAMFYGTQGYVSAMRGGTFQVESEARSAAKVVDSFYLGFNREKSRLAALKTLQKHKTLPYIFACSTDIALGIIDAAKEIGRLDDLVVNGWGGGDAELQAILKGEMDFTVMRMNDDNGVAMADAIALDQNGKSNLVPVIYSGDMILIEKGVDAYYLKELRNRAFRYSDHWRTKTDQVVTFDGQK
ncbi:MAG: substrate-binding domain-containing protein [Terasakiella sp.]|uniref:substrate-binding domain-containing protein n=1 Tax=unclassified Terasakiella TaxID=2614952 RepID=UPI003AFFFF2C